MVNHFKNHIAALLDQYQQILLRQKRTGRIVENILIHSGSDNFYFSDDQTVPFRAYGHLVTGYQ